jgi:prenyltransferase beta subunit
MRYWEIFLKTIFRLAARKPLGKIRDKSIESILKNSISMIDNQTLSEIKIFVIKQQTTEGGFADKGGTCDIYYSLFGYYIAEAMEINEVMPLFREYIKNIVQTNNLKGVYLTCAIIIYSKLCGYETLPRALQRKVSGSTLKRENQSELYNDFINLLAYYYSEDYSAIYSVKRKMKTGKPYAEFPCSVTAANLIIRDIFGNTTEELISRLKSFYREEGSFSAVKLAPVGDLLSTGVALYALKFVNSDFRIIKPFCFNYIDSLYSDGGFCATTLDTDPDLEYTFYGLLALGALSD